MSNVACAFLAVLAAAAERHTSRRSRVIRATGYLLVSLAIIGTMLAFLTVQHADPRASTLDLFRHGVLFASGPSGATMPEEVRTPAGERDALERFLASLRERQADETPTSTVDVQAPSVDGLLTLGQALVGLAVVGLGGGAMLTFGKR
jgi:hypothetical protein